MEVKDHIYKVLLEPLVSNCPTNLTTDEWMETCFALSDRKLRLFYVIEEFKIKGQYIEVPQPVSAQYVFAPTYICKAKTNLLVRHDSKLNKYEVEMDLENELSRLFVIDYVEYVRIQQFIREL